VKLTTHLRLVQRSKNGWSYTSTPPVRGNTGTNMLLWDLFHCKTLYGNVTYRYKHLTDFLNVGVTLLNTKTREINNGRTVKSFWKKLELPLICPLELWSTSLQVWAGSLCVCV
jgi:hypothetical protein